MKVVMSALRIGRLYPLGSPWYSFLLDAEETFIGMHCLWNNICTLVTDIYIKTEIVSVYITMTLYRHMYK